MNNLLMRTLSSLILIPLLFYLIFFNSYLLIFFIFICFVISCYEWNLIKTNKQYKVLGYILLIFSFYTFYALSKELNLISLVIIICISTDIGGYVFGKIFKGPKLIKISPNKTYSGMIGAYLFSLLSYILIINFIEYPDKFFTFLILTIIISTVSQIGDIIISYFKRLSNIKDTGKIIPGHGGLLDRIDGMVFTFPFVFLIKLLGFLNVW